MNATITTPAERFITVTMSEWQATILHDFMGDIAIEHIETIIIPHVEEHDLDATAEDIMEDVVQPLYDALEELLTTL